MSIIQVSATYFQIIVWWVVYFSFTHLMGWISCCVWCRPHEWMSWSRDTSYLAWRPMSQILCWGKCQTALGDEHQHWWCATGNMGPAWWFGSLAVSGRDRRRKRLLCSNWLLEILDSVVRSHDWQLVWLEFVLKVFWIVGSLLKYKWKVIFLFDLWKWGGGHYEVRECCFLVSEHTLR